MKAWLKKVWAKIKAWWIALLVSVGLIAAPALYAAPKDFSWTNATQRVDGSPFNAAVDQAEIRIYCDGDTVPKLVVQGAATAGTADFGFGTHTCYATTVDVYGLESDPSNTVTFEILPAKPNPPVLSVF